MPKQLAQFLAYFVVPVIIASIVIFFAFLQEPESAVFGAKLLSTAGYILLTIILAIKPLSILLPHVRVFKILLGLRREMGLTTFYLIVGHVAINIMLLKVVDFNDLGSFYRFDNFMLWGDLALVCLTLMALTSNNIAVSYLKQNWKRLHYLVFPAYIFASVHWLMQELSPLVLICFTSVAFLKFFEYSKSPRALYYKWMNRLN